MNRSENEGNVVTSILNPGFAATSVMRHNTSRAFKIFMVVWARLAARTAEQGGRTLVHAAYGGPDTHGKYLDHCKIGKVAPYIVSERAEKTQKKLWGELSKKLEVIQPGSMSLV